MKYYSDKTTKFYDTLEQCEKAEKAFDEEKANSSKLKKELSTKIEDANKTLEEAYKKYDDAKKEASEILKEAREKANSILGNARRDVEICQANRTNALVEFNSKFGTYSVKYTGEDAKREFDRTFRLFDGLFDLFRF